MNPHPDSLSVLLDTVHVIIPPSSNYSVQLISLAIAFLAVLVSPLIQYVITKLQIKTQLQVAKDHISAQLKIDEDQIRSDVLSRNRQEWINTLRDTIAEFIGVMSYTIANMGAHPPADLLAKLERIGFLQAKIKLLINPNEDDHRKLLGIIDDLMSYVSHPKPTLPVDKIQLTVFNLVSQAQIILKREWERVKQLS